MANREEKLWADDVDSCSQMSYDVPEVEIVKNSTSVSEHGDNQTSSPKSLSAPSPAAELSDRADHIQFSPDTYKTGACWERDCGQDQCLGYHHPMERRRDAFTHSYGPKRCKYVYQGEWDDPSSCRFGDKCRYAHTANEVRYHPKVYKTAKCPLRPCTKGSICPFSHPSLSHSSNASDLGSLASVPPAASILPAELALSPVGHSDSQLDIPAASDIGPFPENRETQTIDADSSPSAIVPPLPTQANDVKPVVDAMLQLYSDLRERYNNEKSQLDAFTKELDQTRKQLKSTLGKITCGVCNQEEIAQVLQPCGHALCDRCAEQTRTAEQCQVCSRQVSSTCRVRLS